MKLQSGGTKIYFGEFSGFAISDSSGAIFFSDGYNGLVRRVDPVTGVVKNAVAGGASSSPSSGTACGSHTSTDSNGNGCLSTAVKPSNPAALAFDAAGNLYVADVGYANIRKIAATGGLIPATGGVISNVAGSTTYGQQGKQYRGRALVIAATQSYLDEPFGLAFDAAGNLYLVDEGENAIEVINLTGADEMLQGLSIPAGPIAKIMGWNSGADCPSFVSTSSRGGCHFGLWTDGSPAISSAVDSPHQLAVVPGTQNAPNAGYVYFANEFEDNVGQISPSNIITNYAGIQGSVSTKIQRGTAGTFAIGSTFGVAADVYGNVYATDASSGLIWRVDQVAKSMYVVAGGGDNGLRRRYKCQWRRLSGYAGQVRIKRHQLRLCGHHPTGAGYLRRLCGCLSKPLRRGHDNQPDPQDFERPAVRHSKWIEACAVDRDPLCRR